MYTVVTVKIFSCETKSYHDSCMTQEYNVPKKVCLQIHIDHKMFDMFTSRNVKKNL